MTTIEKQINEILKLNTKFFIDIGCSDSTPHSQSEILLDYGWSGIMIEYDKQKYENQKNKMINKNVIVINEKITPENIISLLKNNNVPKDFYLTLDIDGYDYFVLEKILLEYEPSFIITEINEKIPPGVKFTVNYEKDYWWGANDFYGYSISMVENLLEKYNYKILELHYNNLVLVRGNQTDDIANIYYNGYLNQENRKSIFPYNNPYEHIYSLNKDEQIHFLNEKFINYIGKYTII